MSGSRTVSRASTNTVSITRAGDVVRFWREAGADLWFAKLSTFDAHFRAAFPVEYEAAAADGLEGWRDAPETALAEILLLDQYPRNAFRGSPRMYATDALALLRARSAIDRGLDVSIPPALRRFFYLPFSHSESLDDQREAVRLHATLGAHFEERAQHHFDIILRFGRFPHRNVILARASSPEELDYLANGGFQG